MSNEISKLLTNDCVLTFIDGKTVKGAQEVSKVIIRCCESYNHGFMIGMTRELVKGFGIGLVVITVGLGVCKFINRNKSEKLDIKKKA